MALTIDLSPEAEQAAREQAATPAQIAARLEALQESLDTAREWAATHPMPDPPLTDAEISRESIYGERGL